MSVFPESPEDDVIDLDMILVWAKEKRVITGADILGRLLRGIVRREAGRIPATRIPRPLLPGA